MVNTHKSLRHRVVAVVLVVVAAGVAVVVASAGGAGNGPVLVRHGKAHRTPLAVFTHRPKLARIAEVGSLKPSAGAILAAVVGHTDVYVNHDSAGRDCIEHLTAGGAGGGGCASAAKVEEEGSVGVFQEGPGARAPGSPATLSVNALLPNGVRSIKFTDRDGSSYDVPVTNNVVDHEDSNAASVSYTLPGGAVVTTNVAAITDQAPRQPGAAGSSRSIP